MAEYHGQREDSKVAQTLELGDGGWIKTSVLGVGSQLGFR